MLSQTLHNNIYNYTTALISIVSVTLHSETTNSPSLQDLQLGVEPCWFLESSTSVSVSVMFDGTQCPSVQTIFPRQPLTGRYCSVQQLIHRTHLIN